MSENSDDKIYPPSPKKLEESRKKGDVPRSQDLTTAAAYLGFIAAAFIFGADSIIRLGEVFIGLIDLPKTQFTFDISQLILGVLPAIFPWLFVPISLVIFYLLASRSLVFATSKIEPKLSKISPLSNARQKYGRRGLFEFAKSSIKLIIYAAVLGVFLTANVEPIMVSMSMSPSQVMDELLSLIIKFVAVIFVIAAVIGAVDYMFQYGEHMRKNRMSHKELQDESKEQEGDPQLKQKRRAKAQEISQRQMLQDVPSASVVIVNPTHYAVALKWSKVEGGAPICVAKGIDEIAARIREVASENTIPIHRDPPTARALFDTVDIGHEIFPEHFQAVAASIRFADRMRLKMKHSVGLGQ